jgi:electron transport complex protein RnfE
MDGLSMGLGFTLALVIVSVIRELLGRGTLWDIQVLGSWFHPMTLFGMPPGGFLTLGFVIAFTQWLLARKRRHTA